MRSFRKILVTGASGFLGSHVAARLENDGFCVLRPEGVDLTKPEHAKRMMNCYGPEAVIHCAARCSGIDENIARPADFFRDNLLINLNVIHEAWMYGLKRLILIGSASVYPTGHGGKLKEDLLYSGRPDNEIFGYAMAKLSMHAQAECYRRQYGLDCATAVLSNIYGPSSRLTGHVIGAMARKILKAKSDGSTKVKLLGSRDAERDFLFIDDAVDGILMLLHSDSQRDVNFGTETGTTIGQLFEMISLKLGLSGEAEWSCSSSGPSRVLDCSLARSMGWTHKIGISEGLDMALKEMKVKTCK